MAQMPEPAILAAIASRTPVGVMLVGDDDKVSWVNHSLLVMLGVTEKAVVGQSLRQLAEKVYRIIPDDPDLIGVSGDSGQVSRWLHVDHHPAESGKLLFYTDVTKEKNLQAECVQLAEQLRQQSTVDSITGLFTRKALMQNLEPLVSRSRRYSNPLSVMMMDVTNIGLIESDMGIVREDVLLAVSHLLKDQMRWADLIGRVGDNQFLMVLPETPLDAASKLAEKLSERLVTLTVPYGQGAPVTLAVCFGVTHWKKGDDSNLLLRRVGEALLAAKKGAGGTIEVI